MPPAARPRRAAFISRLTHANVFVCLTCVADCVQIHAAQRRLADGRAGGGGRPGFGARAGGAAGAAASSPRHVPHRHQDF